MEKRFKIFLAFTALVLVALCLRAGYIQIVGGQELKAAAQAQSRIKVDAIDGRGDIYDRYGILLTNSTNEYLYIFSNKKTKDYAQIEELMVEIGGSIIPNKNKEYTVYSSSEYTDIVGETLRSQYGAYILSINRRYNDNQSAAHILGYINTLDKEGVNGIEYEMDEILRLGKKNLYIYGDARGNILQKPLIIEDGNGHDNQLANIHLTVDMKLQEKTEAALKSCKRNGAIVVLDSKSGEILAMASTPIYNPNSIDKYLESEKGELVNKATQGQYPPGSIFKIVVAAAALEKLHNERKSAHDIILKCDGKTEIFGLEIGCSTGGEDGHGELHFEEAFAYSCNCAFVELASIVGAEAVWDMAKSMGVGEIPLIDIPNVKKGNLTALSNTAGAGIGNFAIGQGQLTMTPLQVARMTNIVAMQGTDMELSLLKDSSALANVAASVYKNSNSKRAAEIADKYANRSINTGIISTKTALVLSEMMQAVTEYGTASNVDKRVKESRKAIVGEDSESNSNIMRVAGKTGSAEVATLDGMEVHGWFTAYFPADEPKYTVTIFVEKGKSGRKAAVPIFNEIYRYLSDNENM